MADNVFQFSSRTQRLETGDAVSWNDLPMPEIYTVSEIATLLKISRGMAYELVQQGEIPAKRLGRRWVIPRARFHTWLNDLSEGA